MDGTEYITLKEAGEISGYSPDYIGQLIRRGKLAGKQVYANVAWVTTKDALRGYLEEKGKSKKIEDEAPRLLSEPAFSATLAAESFSEKEKTPSEGEMEGTNTSMGASVSEFRKWEQLLRTFSIFIVIASSLFLVLLFHVFSTLIDDRLEVRAMEHAALSESTYHL